MFILEEKWDVKKFMLDGLNLMQFYLLQSYALVHQDLE